MGVAEADGHRVGVKILHIVACGQADDGKLGEQVAIQLFAIKSHELCQVAQHDLTIAGTFAPDAILGVIAIVGERLEAPLTDAAPRLDDGEVVLLALAVGVG